MYLYIENSDHNHLQSYKPTKSGGRCQNIEAIGGETVSRTVAEITQLGDGT